VTTEHRSAANRVLADAGGDRAEPAGEMEVVATDHDAPDVLPAGGHAARPQAPVRRHHGSARHTGGHLAALRKMGVPDDQVAQTSRRWASHRGQDTAGDRPLDPRGPDRRPYRPAGRLIDNKDEPVMLSFCDPLLVSPVGIRSSSGSAALRRLLLPLETPL